MLDDKKLFEKDILGHTLYYITGEEIPMKQPVKQLFNSQKHIITTLKQ